MLNISNEFKQAIMNRDSNINIELDGKFGDTNFHMDYNDLCDIEYTSGCMSSLFQFGGITAGALDFTIENYDGRWNNSFIKNSDIETNIVFDNNGIKEKLPLGNFKPSKVKKNVNNGTILVQSEDAMLRFDKKWTKTDTENFKNGTITLLEKYICDQVLEKNKYSEASVPCNTIVTDTTKLEGMTYRNILNWCGEVRGGYAIINRAGKLEMREFNVNHAPVETITYNELMSLEIADMITNVGVVFFPENGVNMNDGYMYPTVLPPDMGLTRNNIRISLNKNNLFMKQNPYKQQTITEIGKRTVGIEYTAGNFSCYGLPWLEPGDIVKVEVEPGKWRNMVIGKMSLKNHLELTITTPEGKTEGTDETIATDGIESNSTGGSGLPDMTGHAGSVLRTDGTNAFWGVNCGVVKVKPAKTYTSIGWCRVTKSVRKLEKEEWENLRSENI